MLSILYPQGDYAAADVAVRVQALAAGENQTIQVIAKHFGRNSDQVDKQLNQTTAALFIACDQLDLDENSRKELAILQQKPCKIICVVPQNFVFPDDKNLERYTYTQGDTDSFAETVQKFVDELKQSRKMPVPSTQKSDSGASLLIAGGLLVAGIIFLANLNKKE